MKKLFACLLLTALLPLAASTSRISSTHSMPFATVAFAGHNSQGYWCECGGSGCSCDAGENPNGLTVNPDEQDRNESPVSPAPGEGVEFGAVALMLVFFALTLSRLRG